MQAYNRYGPNKSFRVDVCGANYRPLKDAESLGWCWFAGERCALTGTGIAELEGYQINPPVSVVHHICVVCLGTVQQELGADGLPVDTACPHCAALSLDAANRMRERLEEPAG